MKKFIILFGLMTVYCFFNSLTLNIGAQSVMHQIYAANYSIMAIISLFAACSFYALEHHLKSKPTKDEKEQTNK